MSGWKAGLAVTGAFMALALVCFFVGDRLSAAAPAGGFPVLGAFTGEALAALPASILERPLWVSTEQTDVTAGGLLACCPLVVWVVVMGSARPDRTEDAYGSERRGRVRDLAKYRNVASEPDNILLSRGSAASLTGAGTPEIRRGERAKTANSNVCVIGGSGAQKTTSVLEPNLLQGALGSDKDTVSTDPKGATLPRVGGVLAASGRLVVKLDLVDLKSSSVWNPLSIIRSYTDVERVAKALVCGASEGGHSTSEPIWDNGAAQLAAILISYLWAWHPLRDLTMENLQTLLGMCSFGASGRCAFDDLVDELRTGQEKIPASGRKERGASGIRGAAPATTQRSRLRRRVGRAGTPAGARPGPGLGYDYTVASWDRFRGGAAETLGSFKATLAQAIAVFCSPDVLRVLGSRNGGVDEIGLDRLGLGDQRKDVFVVASDRDHTLQPVLSLFVWEAMYVSGRNADSQPDKRLPHHTQFLIDELYALGELPDLPENVVTVRSRNISVLFCIQNLAQLDERYGEHGASTIRDSCATTVYLAGAKSTDTAKRLSEEIGQMTVRKRSESMHGQKALSGKDVSQDVVGRAVYTPQEISRLPQGKALVILGNEYPTVDDKYRIWEHPAYDPLSMFDPNGTRPQGWRTFDYAEYRAGLPGTPEHMARIRAERMARRKKRPPE